MVLATFALVHGAWHGSWCWDLLVEELTRRGHRCVAPDLPFDDPTATGLLRHCHPGHALRN